MPLNIAAVTAALAATADPSSCMQCHVRMRQRSRPAVM